MKKLIFIMVFAMTITTNALASDTTVNKPTTCESREIPRSRNKNVTVGTSAVFRRVIE